ncbi:uncharacterized protein LOC115764423 [Drosophila novamexicana]|uniref:uncharacterized protein LOC115764423 n=1 Tax=Drosophila novamexicana TaxID=47314 RepID=UPI0011E60792|nr:uncharacterized protein LOC115764423 [Drosophila novamexicana]
MQFLRKGFSQLQLVMVQRSPPSQKPELVSTIGSSNLLISKRGLDTLYKSESCEDCAGSYKISPVREDIKKMEEPDRLINKDPCWQALRRTEYKCRTDPEFLLDTFIDASKKCLGNPCAWDAPRLDLTHYKPSDKLKRKYPRTWNNCVVKQRKAKLQCVSEPVTHERRKFERTQKISACEKPPCALGSPHLKLQVCKRPEKKLCPRLTMPFCKSGAVPPTCKKGARGPKKCHKRLTKYPAFSECLIDPLPITPPIECNCYKTPPMCKVWEYFRNKKS